MKANLIDQIPNYSYKLECPEFAGIEALEFISNSTKFEVNSFPKDEIRVQYKDDEFSFVDLTEEDDFSFSHAQYESSWFLR